MGMSSMHEQNNLWMGMSSMHEYLDHVLRLSMTWTSGIVPVGECAQRLPSESEWPCGPKCHILRSTLDLTKVEA